MLPRKIVSLFCFVGDMMKDKLGKLVAVGDVVLAPNGHLYTVLNYKNDIVGFGRIITGDAQYSRLFDMRICFRIDNVSDYLNLTVGERCGQYSALSS